MTVTAAGMQDRDGAHRLPALLRERFSTISLVWADGGYAGSPSGAGRWRWTRSAGQPSWRMRLRLVFEVIRLPPLAGRWPSASMRRRSAGADALACEFTDAVDQLRVVRQLVEPLDRAVFACHSAVMSLA
ncbi:hypothetical protein [Streptomyces sp. S.PNR 29]|uniref:hypothetical protein n=1 Tax=Streptomyces sp. S.PNR 29 TaxID=2973805 RepID=UPI0025B0A18F|nr:hypothetical protein [Streptomyces sp. S.PNR 29]MDN0196239.1 hypothetical protein [Streptomyces sp. S.PNR 29]